MPGKSGNGFAVVTAIARSLPALICPCSGGITANSICVSPCTVAITAGGEPLNGMCTTSMPDICLKSSMLRCDELPLPTDAYESLPGFAFAYATSSAIECTGRLAVTASTLGWLVVVITGARSLSTLYGSFCSSGANASGPL